MKRKLNAVFKIALTCILPDQNSEYKPIDFKTLILYELLLGAEVCVSKIVTRVGN